MTRSLHPGAWLAWACGACVVALTSSDPAALCVALAAIVATGVALGPSPSGSQPWVLMLKLGIAFALLRTSLFALTGHTGATTLFTLPRLELPALAGGLTIGGRVTGEVVVSSALEGLRLTAVLTTAGVVLSAVPSYRLLRMLPRFLAEVGLVVSIALAFVPTLARSLRDVREAQRARGHRLRSPRSLVALVVPVLAGALERSLVLATSMEVRGFGRRAHPRSARANALAASGLVAVTAGVGLLTFGRAAGAVPAGVGALAMWRALRAPAIRTRLRRERFGAADGVVAALTLAAIPVALAAVAAGDAWTPYPVLTVPVPSGAQVAAAALLAVPVAHAVADLTRAPMRVELAPEGAS